MYGTRLKIKLKMNTNKNYFIVGGLVVAIAVLFLLGRAGSNEKESGANLNANIGDIAFVAEEKEFDFGEISMKKGRVTHNFLIKNSSDKPILISQVYTSCMCTQASIEIDGRKRGPFGMPGHGMVPKANENIGAGQDAVVGVTFDPAAHGPAGVGPIERVVRVEGEGVAPLEFTIRANVIP